MQISAPSALAAILDKAKEVAPDSLEDANKLADQITEISIANNYTNAAVFQACTAMALAIAIQGASYKQSLVN